MSDVSSDPITRQGELIVEIAQSVVRSVDGRWTSISYVVKSLSAYQQHLTYITREDATVEREFPPDDVVDLDDDLRNVMYRPGAGTWFTATITIHGDGSLDADFNYDDEPDWTRPVEPVWYRQDLEKFPRSDAAIPDWLRARLTEDTS